jgi:F0F1-type ATP synthase epsilon subunit
MAELSLVLVTPERTLFDKPVASIRVPIAARRLEKARKMLVLAGKD